MAVDPIWIRLGFATRNQYRNAQVAKLTNPQTGQPYTSYRQYRDARARELGRPRDYAEERFRADLRARRQGYTSAKDRQQQNRLRKMELSESKAITFAKWGITQSRFDRIRRMNRAYSAEYQQSGNRFYSDINTYRLDIDSDTKNFSDARVGYIVSFFHANVDPTTNYWSTYKNGRREKEYGHFKTNHWQRSYLVQYAKIMSPSDFEARYGRLAGQ